MRLPVVAALICFVAPLLHAQQDPAPDPPQPGFSMAQNGHPPLPQGSVTGHVLCLDTHAPARGAHVLLLSLRQFQSNTQDGSNQSTSTVTGLDGSYTFPHVAAAEYVVDVEAPGYLSAMDGVLVSANGKAQKDAEAAIRKSGALVSVTANGVARKDVDLIRGATFTGRVTYADGQPASQTKVLLQKVDEPPKDAKLVDTGQVLRMLLQQIAPLTDDQGSFRIAGISPGKYRLAVVQLSPTAGLMDEMMAAMGQGGASAKNLTIYSGNTLHVKSATTYDVVAGDVRDGINIVLPLGGLEQISGHITNKTGLPVDTARLELTDTADASLQFSTRAKIGGEYRFAGVPPGTYTLKVTGGRIFENAPTMDLPEEQMEAMQGLFKATHAFADTTQSLIVKETDVENLNLALEETALPKPPADGGPSYDTVGPK